MCSLATPGENAGGGAFACATRGYTHWQWWRFVHAMVHLPMQRVCGRVGNLPLSGSHTRHYLTTRGFQDLSWALGRIWDELIRSRCHVASQLVAHVYYGLY